MAIKPHNAYTLVCAGLFSALACSGAHAAAASDSGAVRVSTSVGMLKGESREYVFQDDGSRLSQLNWKIPNTPIGKLRMQWDISSYLTLDVQGWKTLDTSTSSMDDYDWDYGNGHGHWSDWSHSPTRFHSASEINAALYTWLITQPTWKAGLATGYQKTHLSWSAMGGHYVYNDGQDVGDFPADQRGLEYRQRYELPWIGIASKWSHGAFEMNLLAKYSNKVKGDATDNHLLRDLHFEDRSNDGSYYGLSVDAGYYVIPNLKLYSELTLSQFKRNKGHEYVYDTATGERGYAPDGSVGQRSQSYTASIGIQSSF